MSSLSTDIAAAPKESVYRSQGPSVITFLIVIIIILLAATVVCLYRYVQLKMQSACTEKDTPGQATYDTPKGEHLLSAEPPVL